VEVVILPDEEAVAALVSDAIVRLLQRTPGAVLGLTTGSSPLPSYRSLIRRHQRGEVSFARARGFLLDDYVGLPPGHPESYRAFIHRELVEHVDFAPGAVTGPDVHADDLAAAGPAYDEAIRAAGGVDLQLLGIGTDGHIAFNEPGSSLSSRTRIKTLTHDTRIANARFFGNDPNKVPKTALTVGVGTVMDAQEVIILVSGHGKSRALQKVVEEGVNHMWTVSQLQLHRHGMIVCDEESTHELKVGTVKYFKDIEGEHLALPKL
jgi:glucosamine-6-phosphate deaminase